MSERKSLRVLIEGRVQGVWFRAWTEQQARERGLEGWVRNRRDGRVEAVFCGPAADVDTMVEACWTGPRAARVDNVSLTPTDPPSQRGFQMLPTN